MQADWPEVSACPERHCVHAGHIAPSTPVIGVVESVGEHLLRKISYHSTEKLRCLVLKFPDKPWDMLGLQGVKSVSCNLPVISDRLIVFSGPQNLAMRQE